MNQTTMNINIQEPKMVYKINTGSTSLSFNPETDLDKYSRIFISKGYDPFKLVCWCESLNRDYKIFGETKDRDKKLLFTCSPHFQCCKCCDQCIIGDLCFGYVCCNSIIFQMDYRRNGAPFYTQGFNLSKGCHCCDFYTCCFLLGCCICTGNKLYLRENIDPDSPDPKIGRPKGKTQTNCCCSCGDKFAEYINVNNLKGPTVRAPCCEMCKNNCLNCLLTCGGICSCYSAGFDFEISIENQNGIKTGNIMIYSGCCSKKVEGKMCYFPRSYMEVNLPQDSTSEQKFQIIADAIHLDISNKFL